MRNNIVMLIYIHLGSLWYDKVIIQHGIDPKMINPTHKPKESLLYSGYDLP